MVEVLAVPIKTIKIIKNKLANWATKIKITFVYNGK